ncbi:MAG: menaquinone biosynthesis protein [Planctomycetota bacterium]
MPAGAAEHALQRHCRGRFLLTPLRIGSVPYLNARPLVEGLGRDPSVVFQEKVPSELAKLLQRGELDVALVSSIEAFRVGRHLIVPGHCIASRGTVMSVRLVGKRDPRQAGSVALDGASLTAAALTRVAYGSFWNRTDVTFRTAGVAPDPDRTDCDATLLIGDTALKRPPEQAREIDLGKVWTDETGLPFVWAVWLRRPETPEKLVRQTLDHARRLGEARLTAYAREAAPRLGISFALAHAYLNEAMRYGLGPEEEAALDQFERSTSPLRSLR